VIPEPQLTYLLELLYALGPATADFVVAGAQAMKCTFKKAQATKDVDFLPNVVALRKEPLQLARFSKRSITKPLQNRAIFSSRKYSDSQSDCL
jgi:hypothetical protein